MSDLTHWKKMTNPTYLGSYDFQPNEKRVLIIDRVVQEKIKGQDGKEEECIVCYFDGTKPMILNVTNCKAIAQAHGTNFIEEWSGKEVTLFTATISAFGQVVEALRIEQTAPKPKPFISEAKFDKAVQSVKEGKTTVEKIQAVYQLTEEQIKLLSI